MRRKQADGRHLCHGLGEKRAPPARSPPRRLQRRRRRPRPARQQGKEEEDESAITPLPKHFRMRHSRDGVRHVGLRRARCRSDSCCTERASASCAATWPPAARRATRCSGTPTRRRSSRGRASTATAPWRSCPRRSSIMSRSSESCTSHPSWWQENSQQRAY
jgi:hypothetical protein